MPIYPLLPTHKIFTVQPNSVSHSTRLSHTCRSRLRKHLSRIPHPSVPTLGTLRLHISSRKYHIVIRCDMMTEFDDHDGVSLFLFRRYSALVHRVLPPAIGTDVGKSAMRSKAALAVAPVNLKQAPLLLCSVFLRGVPPAPVPCLDSVFT